MMTMEVDVEELCKMTVAKTPIMRPVMGFCRSSFSWNTFPVQRWNSKQFLHFTKIHFLYKKTVILYMLFISELKMWHSCNGTDLSFGTTGKMVKTMGNNKSIMVINKN